MISHNIPATFVSRLSPRLVASTGVALMWLVAHLPLPVISGVASTRHEEAIASSCFSTNYNVDKDSLTHSRKLKIFWFKSIPVLSPWVIHFGSNIHQVVQRLGLGARPHCGTQSAPDPIARKGEGERMRRGRERGREGRWRCLLLNSGLATPFL